MSAFTGKASITRKKRISVRARRRLVRWYKRSVPKYSIPLAFEVLSWWHEFVAVHRKPHHPPQNCGGRSCCRAHDRGDRYLCARTQSRHGYHDRADANRYQGWRPGGVHRPQRSGYPIARPRLLSPSRTPVHPYGLLRIVPAARCPLLAQSGHAELHCTCPLLWVKRTCLFGPHMSAFDPKRTLAWSSSAAGFAPFLPH